MIIQTLMHFLSVNYCWTGTELPSHLNPYKLKLLLIVLLLCQNNDGIGKSVVLIKLK